MILWQIVKCKDRRGTHSYVRRLFLPQSFPSHGTLSDLKAVWQVKRLNWLWRKLTAAFWVSAACGIIWYTNFFRRSAQKLRHAAHTNWVESVFSVSCIFPRQFPVTGKYILFKAFAINLPSPPEHWGVIWESPLVNRTYFYLALACLAFNMSMLAYLALWCTTVLKIEEPWETKHPKAQMRPRFPRVEGCWIPVWIDTWPVYPLSRQHIKSQRFANSQFKKESNALVWDIHNGQECKADESASFLVLCLQSFYRKPHCHGWSKLV